MTRPPCPICWHEETMRCRQTGDPEPDLRPEETLEWHRPYGGARGQVVTRWDGGSWRCPTCDVSLTPRDAAVLLDAVLTTSWGEGDWRDDEIMRGWVEAAAKGGRAMTAARCPRCARTDCRAAPHAWRAVAAPADGWHQAADDDEDTLSLNQACKFTPVDWRTRALAAEADVARLRAALDDLATPERDGPGLRHTAWDRLASLRDAGEACEADTATDHDAARDADVREAGAALARILGDAP